MSMALEATIKDMKLSRDSMRAHADESTNPQVKIVAAVAVRLFNSYITELEGINFMLKLAARARKEDKNNYVNNSGLPTTELN